MDYVEILEPPLMSVVEAMRGAAFEGWLAEGSRYGTGQNLYLPEVALVFSDVVGSTALLFELGDDVYDSIMQAHFDRARFLLGVCDGLEIDTAGDGLFCAFRNVSDAVGYAQSLSADTGDSRIRIRAGIHSGQTKFRGRSFCGKTVHFASRVMSHAVGAEIWLSDDSKRELRTLESQFKELELEEFPECTLKNIPGTWRLWRVAAVSN